VGGRAPPEAAVRTGRDLPTRLDLFPARAAYSAGGATSAVGRSMTSFLGGEYLPRAGRGELT
jgi:hypothetical protein